MESDPAGTGGAVRLAAAHVRGETFLVLNDDSFFDIPLDHLVATHLRREATLTLALAPTPDPARYGSVSCDAEGRVTRFEEKKENVRGSAEWVNAGIYVFSRHAVAAIPPQGAVSLEREVFPSLVGRGLCAHPFDGFFIDIGVPEDYERVRSSPEPLLAAVAGASA